MTSKVIYNHSAFDRTPYTYLIGWTDMDLWYYGRRTAKDCHPEELFIKYFTSSDTVQHTREEFGEPDIIKIHMFFSDAVTCKVQEERFLKRVNAARNPRFLNKTNGDLNWDTTGIKNTEEQKNKNSAKNSGRTPYKMTDVVRQNMSIAQTGAIRGPMSQESKDKKSASLKGKNLGRISPLKCIKVGPKEGSKSEQIIKLISQGLSRDVVAEIVNVRLAYVGKIVRRHKEKLAEAA